MDEAIPRIQYLYLSEYIYTSSISRFGVASVEETMVVGETILLAGY